MSQRQWVIIIGVWVGLFLFLGFPSSWEPWIAVLTGLVIIIFAYRMKFKENAEAVAPVVPAAAPKEAVITESSPKTDSTSDVGK
jgi:uncharacterized membrane protein YfcA